MNNEHQHRLVTLLNTLAPFEGYTLAPLEGVRFMRANRALPRIPVLYEPSIVIVCQGRKRGYLADASYVYDAHHYLVLSVPLPFESETEADENEPMLAVALRIDLRMAAELALALNKSGKEIQDGVSAATASSMVGYESSSQFSREFKRFFGRTPLQEAVEMKSALMLMQAELPPQYAM